MFVASLLAAVAMQAPTAQSPAPAKDPEERVCKRIEITGSIARKERVCKSRAEWMRLAESGNSAARAIVDHGVGRPAGGP